MVCGTEPDIAGDEHPEHLGGADAEHVRAEGPAGARMAVAADGEHARAQMPALGQHYVADALPVVEIEDAGVRRPVSRDVDDAPAFLVVGGKVMVGDEHYLRRVPDLRAQALEHRFDAPRPARVMHHGEIHLAGDDLARRDRGPAGGARDELLGKRLEHYLCSIFLAHSVYFLAFSWISR
jgi:hypothetical protein